MLDTGTDHYNHLAGNQPQMIQIASVPLKLNEYIELDNGSAHLGFVQETANLVNVALLEKWNFVSEVNVN